MLAYPNRMPRVLLTVATGLAIVAVIATAHAASQAPSATLFRDSWGVPHVYADTLGAAVYALGYAQAEDRIDDLFTNIRTAVGSMAEAFGPEYLEQDYVMRLVQNAERSARYWETAPENVRELGDMFMRGVQKWLDQHPEKAPAFATPLHGWQCLAIGRAMTLKWPLEALMGELAHKRNARPFASNSFAVSPARSAGQAAILMTDPHLTWEGMAVFHEARVHAGAVGMAGFWLVGSPLPALGHGNHVAWACTTGGPDTSDVYMLTLNPDDPLQYQFDEGWHDFEIERLSIEVLGQDPVERPVIYSALGPLLEPPDPATGIAYCGASPYFTADRLLEQMLAMVCARDVDEFYEALRMKQLMEQNVMVADRAGNIRYVRNGATPIRPDGFNWKAPVPWSPESHWLGIHDIEDLVQIMNPPQGYLQNCNVSPEFMTRNSPMTPDKHSGYIYNVGWDYQTPRGARLLALLDADDSITTEAAMTYTLDVYDILAERWQRALETAVQTNGARHMADPQFAGAVEKILAWDGHFTRESVAAPIIRFWRLKCEPSGLTSAIAEQKPLDDAQQALLLALLAQAVEEIKAQYGHLDITWGDINLIGRGGRYFASPGAEFGSGGQMARTETVMDLATRELAPGSGKFVGYDGSSSIMLSFLYPDGIKSYSLLNWGQSGNPDSPHYLDQAEKLYAERTFKPTWFAKEELLQHVESKKTLVME
jgi:acyl-homoserine-lactone acylase